MKKLDLYILKRFLLLLSMTFLICIFILLMQFLWMHVKDLVGKGISVGVLMEFFGYAFFTMIPLGLPLAILLASLMTFGNLGESFELTAMKAAGVSLFRIMRSLIIFISFVCIGAFFFSNYVLPVAQAKLWTLIFSLRQKSPELDIPTGEFYSGINGLNVYVRQKESGMLKNIMIYDFSSGFENATVMVADTGYVQVTADKKYLKLTLRSGESFENLRQQGMSSTSTSIPYRRETFRQKEILIDFDSDLNLYDESIMKDQHVSKNIFQLAQSVDSVNKVLDVQLSQQGRELVQRNYFGRERFGQINLDEQRDTAFTKVNTDSLFLTLNQSSMESAITSAITHANEKKSQIEYNKIVAMDTIMYARRHTIEMHRKFTLSFACLVFFFIGAPLGAIIRKGGFGLPAVISVLLFIVYYIIDQTGYKMARDGVWEIYQGMWLSSVILLPVGIFLTYKAAVDATLFSSDQYKKIFENLKKKIKHFKKQKKAIR